MSRNLDKRPGLNLLSLDGGGITGLSSLLIIKEIMLGIQGKQRLEAVPKPCEHFDIIAGTGTGAISAVMLGRLQMSVDEAITSYVKQMGAVFSERKYSITGNTGTFKATVLERQLKEMVRGATGNENDRMKAQVQGEAESQCKV
ncbi:unnamed protein product [Rhizoctonia solani]|uniref:PNPLA domain-containing protein n=1 Tax=Rhizoctonia solani TaxID=456999 RepID=A0A8H3AHU9_9AGAM|nr:unnamed protein product [Rhizoctonia solani]